MTKSKYTKDFFGCIYVLLIFIRWTINSICCRIDPCFMECCDFSSTYLPTLILLGLLLHKPYIHKQLRPSDFFIHPVLQEAKQDCHPIRLKFIASKLLQALNIKFIIPSLIILNILCNKKRLKLTIKTDAHHHSHCSKFEPLQRKVLISYFHENTSFWIVLAEHSVVCESNLLWKVWRLPVRVSVESWNTLHRCLNCLPKLRQAVRQTKK
jgi:hypothetical protein